MALFYRGEDGGGGGGGLRVKSRPTLSIQTPPAFVQSLAHNFSRAADVTER